MVVFVVQCVDRYYYFCVNLALLLLYQALLSNLLIVTCLLDKKTDVISIREYDGPSRQILGQNLTWAIGFSNQVLSHRILQYRTT